MAKRAKREKSEERSHKCDSHLVRDEEKSAVSIGLVFGVAYLLVGAFVSIAPGTSAAVLKALTFGLVEVSSGVPASDTLIIGLISATIIGVVGGFFYAKIYNFVKKS